MRPSSFYQQQLDAVSRSFALCIPQLESPFRDRVTLAYLLMRVLDTVEDASFQDKHAQAQQFDRLRGFLRARPTHADVDAFIAGMPAQVSDGERGLIRQTLALLEDAYALPAPARASIFGAMDRMAEGMAAYARRPRALCLIDLEDVTRYCCFVAGVVGEMLTQLWMHGRSEPPPAMALAYHFGIFLQKVNLLKDQAEDEAAGRFLVPDRRELLASVGVDARCALEYLLALPRTDRGYRTFCAWSLMLGAVTVAQLIDQPPDLLLDQPKRSRRAETARLLARTSDAVGDNAALTRLFDELMPALPQPSAPPRAPLDKPESPAWFRASLAAPLTDAELRRLGIDVLACAVAC